MAEAGAKDRLAAYLDERLFRPILDADPSTVPEGERLAFAALQDRLGDWRETWLACRSAEELVASFERDWHSDAAVEARRGLARVGYPVAPAVRDDFLALAREFGLSTEQKPPPVVSGAPEAERRIRERARRLWEADGRPKGREDEYFERARELEEIAENPGAALIPNPMRGADRRPSTEQPVEEVAVAVENQADIPGFMTDQGERPPEPTHDAAKPER
jgi:hypothetical protein